MGYKSFTRAEEKYQIEVKRLDEIAHAVWNSDRGHFERKMADAWVHADSFNKRILHEAWATICTKYSLAEEIE